MRRKVAFMLNGASRQQIVLNAGDVVQAATLAQVPVRDLSAYQRMEAQHAAAHRNQRLVWVRAHGMVRGLVAELDCEPCRLPATVPA
jgi:hypothetical protein